MNNKDSNTMIYKYIDIFSTTSLDLNNACLPQYI